MAKRKPYPPDKLFACYRGDAFEFMGTRKEVEHHYGWKDRKTLTFFLSNTYKKRIEGRSDRFVIIPVDLDE